MHCMDRLAWLSGGLLLTIACGGPSVQPNRSSLETPTEASRTPGESATAPPRSYIVGTSDGVLLVDIHGKILKRISRQPATYVWKFGGERILTLARSTLRLLDTNSSEEVRVTKIPNTASCSSSSANPYEHDLFYQAVGGASIASKGGAIRLNLADSAYDAGFEVDITVCLETGKSYGEAETNCTVKGMESGPAPCAGLFSGSADLQHDSEEEPSHPPHDFPYDIDEEGRITKGSKQERLPMGGPLFALEHASFSIRSTSDSGRWALLSGPEFDASNFYVLHLLLDRKQGQLYPLATSGGPFPLRIPVTEWETSFTKGAGGGPGGPDSWISYDTDVEWVEGVPNVLRVGSRIMHLDTKVVAELGGLPAI